MKHTTTVLFCFFVSLCVSFSADASRPTAPQADPFPRLPEKAFAPGPDGFDEKTLDAARQTLIGLLGVRGLFAAPFEERPALEPVTTGTLAGDGFAVEKLYYQSLPEFFVPANLYLPDTRKFPGKRPAVVCPHGHWDDGKADRNVQTRARGLVKQGYVVLAYDAIGISERLRGGIPEGYDYCANAAASVGGPLSVGLQAYELSRAIDYLLTRDEVDAGNIGITGASGGGSLAIWFAALGLDRRAKSIVPVGFADIGSHHGLGAGDENVPYLGRAIDRTLLLAMAHPASALFLSERPVPDMDVVKRTYKALGHENRFGYRVLPGEPHGYGRGFRAVMYAWMDRWLKGKNVGATLPDPPGVSGDMELFSYRDLVVGIPKGKSFLEIGAGLREGLPRLGPPKSKAEWISVRDHVEKRVRRLANLPESSKPSKVLPGSGGRITVVPEEMSVVARGVPWPAEVELELTTPNGDGPFPFVLLVNPVEYPDRTSAYREIQTGIGGEPAAAALLEKGFGVCRITTRFEKFPKGFDPGNRADEYQAMAARILNHEGTPLFWRRVHDTMAAVNYLLEYEGANKSEIVLWGLGHGGAIALAAGALDERIHAVVADRSPLSFNVRRSDRHPVWWYPPKILTAADLPHIAAMIAPRRLIVANPVRDDRVPLPLADAKNRLGFTRAAYHVLDADANLMLRESAAADEVVRMLHGAD